MPWYGQPENEAQKAARQKQKKDAEEQIEAQQRAEAARDPYNRKVSWNLGRGTGR